MADPKPILLGHTSYDRSNVGEFEVICRNRYFEENPTNFVDQVGLMLRPGTRRRIAVGDGPIRLTYMQPGAFGDNLFAVSGSALYRIARAAGLPDTPTLVTGTIGGDDAPEITTPTKTRLYIADGTLLQTTDNTNILSTVAVPDDAPIRSVGSIAGYTICVVNGSDRFYWIAPGETTIDPLDFATAESAPDPTQNVRIIGDQIWFYGKGKTEVWYLTGNAEAPFLRTQGRVFDKGVWQGTVVAIPNLDMTILVGIDGIVYNVSGAPQRISTNGIESRIRAAMIAETQMDGY